MLRQRLTYVLPIGAAVVVAFVLLGPGQSRPVEVARVYGVGSELRSARLFVAQRAEGQEAPLGGARISVHVAGEPSPRASGQTDEGGALELRFEPPVEAGTVVRVLMGDEVLCEGPLQSEAGEVSVVESAHVASTLAPGISVRVGSERGALVPPFSERVSVSVTRDGRPAAATIELSAISGELAQSSITAGTSGKASLTLTPLAQPVMLSLQLRGEGLEADAEVSLGVEMSGMYVAPELVEGRVSVLSPGLKERAYLSYYGRDGRLGGASVPLAEDERGYFRGLAPQPPPEGTLAVVASAEATEKGRSTIAWPAPGRIGAATAPTLGLALDGTRARVEAERRRVAIVRTATVAGLSAVAALEIALLLWTGRRERRKLARFADALGKELGSGARRDAPEEEQAAGLDAAPPPAALRARFGSERLLIAVIGALVLLSFAMIALLLLR